MFETILGNEDIKDYFDRMIHKGSVAHSLLFSGPEGIGKGIFALELACKWTGADKERAFSGDHPDVKIFKPQGKMAMHPIESIKSLTEEVYMLPFEASRKAFIVHDAEKMLSTSANALLKTFEEPANDTLIILLTNNPKFLLPTIVSRCRHVRFKPIEQHLIVDWLQKNFGPQIENAKKIALLSRGSLNEAIHIAQHGIPPYRDLVLENTKKWGTLSYQELRDFVVKINEQIEEIKKDYEQEARSLIANNTPEYLNANEKASLEKEVAAYVGAHYHAAAYEIFDLMLTWFRDINLAQLAPQSEHFIHDDCKEELLMIAQNGDGPNLEAIFQAIQEAELSLQRFTPFSSVFETFCLRCGILG
ncbi:MAG: hypothetical protein Tsb0021_04110 [Chlamydiales bacterium]